MWNSSKPIKFPQLWKLANQSTLNKACMIEIAKACKVAFIPSLFVIERNVSVGKKKNKMVKIYFLKLPGNRFWLASIKWTSWKGNDMFT